MAATGAVSTWGGAEDPAYPGETPVDAVLPGQTVVPLCPLFDGVALPAIWSRLRSPLGRALGDLWRALRLGERARPRVWVGMRAGCFVINAHGWERLEAVIQGREPDPTLVLPAKPGWSLFTRPLERMRIRRALRALALRVDRAETRAVAGLDRAEEIDIASLDTPPLARGPLDEWIWAEVLIPWFVARAADQPIEVAAKRVQRALRVEQRFAAELGRRMVNAGVLHKRGDVAYLTVEERIQAVVDGSRLWMRVVEARAQRVQVYVDREVPQDRGLEPRSSAAHERGTARPELPPATRRPLGEESEHVPG